MGLPANIKNKVNLVLRDSLRNKFLNYKPETKYMPFHYRLLGKDRMALFSFIQSLNTTFGTSIYEPVAIALAEGRFKKTICQEKPFNKISENAQVEIENIMRSLTTAKANPNKLTEIQRIREKSRSGKLNEVKLTNIDIYLETYDSEKIFIDLKTVKPNIGEFKGFKRTLLEWVAAETSRNDKVNIKTAIGIPYNPYEPEPYDRWTMKGLFDLKEEVLVADELWDYIGGKGTYNDLLDCFEKVGIELRPEIDKYFSTFQK